MRYAGFWIRVGASIIDTLIMCIIFIPTAMYLYDFNSNSTQITSSSMSFYSSSFHIQPTNNIFLNYILPAILVLLFWLYKSATPGKLITKLKIVDAKTGNKPTTIQFFLRYIGYFLSSIFFLGFIWIAFDRRKQGWHDKLAGTVVLRNSMEEAVQFDQ